MTKQIRINQKYSSAFSKTPNGTLMDAHKFKDASNREVIIMVEKNQGGSNINNPESKKLK